MNPIIREAIPSKTAIFRLNIFANDKDMRATITPLNADTSSIHTKRVVGELIFPTFFTKIFNFFMKQNNSKKFKILINNQINILKFLIGKNIKK